ncbi:MAG: AGE family epimerase/isomerase [Oscillospiraceae bacterium]|nr:AGE family epimerase/isomerase [Oscillospiraceae bacterium]
MDNSMNPKILQPVFKPESRYYKYASEAQDNLIKNYWNGCAEVFFDKFPQRTAAEHNYWWMAHAIDTLTDAYFRTGDTKYKEYADKTLAAVIKRNKGKIINDYYDDMQWMALALLRLFDYTREQKYMIYTEDLWSDIIKGWNSHMGGGIAWRKQQPDYKNTPANAPAAILAARLYNTLGDNIYLEWAKKLFDFVDDNLTDKRTGQIWDGINRMGGGAVDKQWVFTYCHGVYAGAAAELYKITGEQEYLNKAALTAGFALERFISGKSGVFADEGEGDGGMFKGILFRYLTELYKINSSNHISYTNIKNKFYENIEILRKSGTNEDGRIGRSWLCAPGEKEGFDLTVQLSGTMLYEMAAVIEALEN